MSDNSNIEWLRGGATWNPIRARFTDPATGKVRIGWHCEHASAGCINCYAEQINKGFFQLGTKQSYTRPSREKVEVFLDEETLLQPLRWRKPRYIFPCSMTDWMGEWVPDDWIDKILAVAALCPQHTFMSLTKRADRLCEYLNSGPWGRIEMDAKQEIPVENIPLKNVWLGVSVEDQKTADERIPPLLQTPAAVRWVSAEPLIGPVDFENYPIVEKLGTGSTVISNSIHRLDWIVLGGESGSHARPFDLQWARGIIQQAKASQVAVFVKQVGSHPIEMIHYKSSFKSDLPFLHQFKDKKGGSPEEWPADLRVRQFPEVTHER